MKLAGNRAPLETKEAIFSNLSQNNIHFRFYYQNSLEKPAIQA